MRPRLEALPQRASTPPKNETPPVAPERRFYLESGGLKLSRGRLRRRLGVASTGSGNSNSLSER
jgi:hypothetical protein